MSLTASSSRDLSPTFTNPSVDLAGEPVQTRVLSIDILRGITMALMIFVNDLASVHGLSKWTYHMPARVDAMTYVDMVFPTFLFVLGMAIPLAIRQRLRRDPSIPHLWGHVVLRAVSLVVIGLVLANIDYAGANLLHLNANVWGVLALLGAVLLWLVPPPSTPKTIARTIRIVGLVLLVVMLVTFRRITPDGTAGWLNFSYPEILGLIGLTYLGACILYIPTRLMRWAPSGFLICLIVFNMAACSYVLPLGRHLRHIPMYINLYDNGAMCTLTMAGIVVSSAFIGPFALPNSAAKIRFGLIFSTIAFVLACVLIPFGISKIRATPSWALWTISAATLLFVLLFWLCDVHKHTRWAAPFRAPGSNTLLTYLLPDLYVYIAGAFGFTHLLGQFDHGLPGITRAVLFTCGMLVVSWLITRAKLRLQL